MDPLVPGNDPLADSVARVASPTAPVPGAPAPQPDQASSLETSVASVVGAQAATVRNNLYNAQGTNPADESHIAVLANQTGLAPDTVRAFRNTASASAALAQNHVGTLQASYPVTTQFLTDPQNMNQVHHQIPNVASLEGTVASLPQNTGDSISSLGTAALHGLESAGASIRNVLVDLEAYPGYLDDAVRGMMGMQGPSDLDALRAIRAQNEAGQQAIAPGADASIPQQIAFSLGNLAGYFPGLIATGGLEAPLAGEGLGALLAQKGTQALANGALMGTTSAEQTYHDVYAHTGDVGQAVKAATGAYLLSGAQMGLPLSLEGNVLTRGVTAAAMAVPTAHLSTEAMNLVMPPDMQQTLTGGQMASQVVTQTILGALLGGRAEPGVTGQIRQTYVDAARAKDAADNYSKLQTLNTTAANLDLKKNNPQAFNQLVQSITDHNNVSDLYVNPEQLQSALAANPDVAQALQESMPDLGQKIAAANGVGDVRIPVADYATHLMGTPVGDAIMPDTRASVGGMTYREGQEYYQTEFQKLKDLADTITTTHAQTVEGNAQYQQAYNDILSQLNDTGRFAPEVNQVYATLAADGYAARAKSEGVTPAEMMQRYPLNIRGEPLAGAHDPLTAVAQEDPSALLNVGLHVNGGPDNGGTQLTPQEALAHIEQTGAKVTHSAVHISDTGPTLVARTDRALTEPEMEGLSKNLHQEAIPQLHNGRGQLYGPQKEAWGPFNPQYFRTLDGRRLAELDSRPVTGDTEPTFNQAGDGHGERQQQADHAGALVRDAGRDGVHPGDSGSVPVSASHLRSGEAGSIIGTQGRDSRVPIPLSELGHAKAGDGNGKPTVDNAVALVRDAGRSGISTGLGAVQSGPYFRSGPVGGDDGTPRGTSRIPVPLSELGHWTLDPKLAKVLNDAGISTPAYVGTEDAEHFAARLAEAKAANKHGYMVLGKTAEELRGLKKFITEDGTVGFAIKPDGELTAVFKSPGSPHTRAMESALFLAKQHGATKTAAFNEDGRLPNLYARAGFKPVMRAHFEADKFPDWPKDAAPRDVVYSVLDHGYNGQYSPEATPLVASFADARNSPLWSEGKGSAGVSVTGIHYSHAPRGTLEGRFFGTGINSAEGRRVRYAEDARLRNRTAFYTDEGKGVTPGSGLGRYRHEVPLDTLYDASTNPLHLASTDRNGFESAVLDAGYKGYYVKKAFGEHGAAVLLGDHANGVRPTSVTEAPRYNQRVPEDRADAHTTIVHNGVERPNVSSTGTVISPTKQGLENFWNWFGNSKAIDANGRPVTMYHSTVGDFNTFELRRPSGLDQVERHGIFMTPDIQFSSLFGAREPGHNTMPLYAKLDNPIDLRNGMTEEIQKALGDHFDTDFPLRYDWELFDDQLGEEFTRALKGAGYDGAIIKEANFAGDGGESEVYVALEPQQVKSATGNSGEYGRDNPNVLHQKDALGFFSPLRKAIAEAPTKAFGSGDAAAKWLEANAAKMGVKSGELYWTGVTDWLRAQPTVSRDDVARYLDGGASVHIAEMAMGNGDEEDSPSYADYVLPGKKIAYQESLLTHEGRTPPPADLTRRIEVYKGDIARMDGILAQMDAAVNPHPNEGDRYAYMREGRAEKARLLAEAQAKQDAYVRHATRTAIEGMLKRYDRREEVLKGAMAEETGPQTAKRLRALESLHAQRAEAQQRLAALGPDPHYLKDFESGHFEGTPNIVAHMRHDIRMDADGRPVFFLEELQSDWAQLARSTAEKSGEPIPEGPFVHDTKAWTGLLMKRAIIKAIESGADKVAWTTGEQQADRYALAKHVSRIAYGPEGARTKGKAWEVRAYRKPANGPSELVYKRSIKGEKGIKELEADLGAEMAQKIRDGEGEHYTTDDYRHIEGTDLQVGGKGMKAFYDGIVPQVASDVIKRFGGRLESVHLNLDGEESLQRGFTITPEMRKSVLETGLPLFQGEHTGTTRGYYNPQDHSVTLTKNANLSTFVHELGHHFLEMTLDLASRPDASEALVHDRDTLLHWLGVPDTQAWRGMSVDEQRPMHEKFAESFERYLLDGKAPTLALQGVFNKVKGYMLGVYGSIKSFLRANPNAGGLSPEVRQVFDRMLASEDAIRETEQVRGYAPLFGSAAEAGLTENDFRDYTSMGREATDAAVGDMQTRSMRDMKYTSGALSRQLQSIQKEAASKRKEIAAKVQAEVEKWPINQARRWLRKGEMTAPDGGEIKVLAGHKLNSDAIKTMYPESALGNPDLAKLRGLTSKDGMHPDTVADMFGLPSGDALVRTLAMGDTTKADVTGITDQRMLEQHAELSHPASIRAAAESAIHNDVRARFVATGLKILTKSAIPVRQLVKAAQEIAGRRIGETKVGELNARQYTLAEARANKEALKNAPKDPAAAIKAQRAALLNNQLARSAMDATDAVRKGVGYLKKFSRDSIRKNLSGEFLGQIDDLLSKVDLRQAPPDTNPPAERLAAWADSLRKAGYEPQIDAALAGMQAPPHYKDMTVDQFHGLVSTVKSMEHIGRMAQELRVEGKTVALRDAVTQIKDRLAERTAKFTAEELLNPPNKHDGLWARATHWASTWLRMGANDLDIPEMKFNKYDMHAIDGPMRTFVLEPMFRAAYKKADMQRAVSEKFRAIGESLGREWQNRLDDYVTNTTLPDNDLSTPEKVVMRKLTRGDMLGIARHVGNESNFAKLTKGMGWDGGAVWRFLDANMTAKDWQATQAQWDAFDPLWKESLGMIERLGGVPPEKIPARSFPTRFGVMRGGYAPIDYDPIRSRLAARKGEFNLEGADRLTDEAPTYTATTTFNGSLNARQEGYTDRIRLDYHGVEGRIRDTIHDLAYREALIDVSKIMQDRAFREKFTETFGREEYDSLVSWRRGIQTMNSQESDIRGFEKALQYSRAGLVMTGIAYRLSTVLKHGGSAAFKSMGSLPGGRSFLASRAFRMTTGNASADIAGAIEKFDEIRFRKAKQDRDYSEGARSMFEPEGWRAKNERYGHALVAWSDLLTAVPTAWAAYDMAKTVGVAKEHGGTGAPMSEEAAVEYANSIVRQAHGTALEAARSTFMQQRGVKGLFGVLYGFMNNSWGQQRDMWDKAFVGGHFSDKPELAARALAQIVIPALWAAYLYSGPQDDESGLWWAAKALMSEVGATVPFVRDAENIVTHGAASPVAPVQLVTDLVNSGVMAKQEVVDDKHTRLVQTVANTIGEWAHVGGLGEAGHVLQYLSDVRAGTKQPDGPAEAAKGALIGGPPKK